MSENVYVIGTGLTKFGKFLDKSVKQLSGKALDLVLKDCGLARKDIQAAWFSNSTWGYMSFQNSIRGQVALSANGLDGIPIVNVENACASGSTAFHMAWMAIKSGLYDCVLAIGAEKLHDTDRGKVMAGFISGADVDVVMEIIGKFQGPENKIGGHSAFMDFYAIGARNHMNLYGTTQKQLAVIASKAHNNSTLNPLAQYTFPMSVEAVLNDRQVTFPLTRAMCSPVGDGAAAAILCSENFMKKHNPARALRIRASVLQSGLRAGENEFVDYIVKAPTENEPPSLPASDHTDIARRTSQLAYEASSIGPKDIDVAEVHDATAFGELVQTENMGFCKTGDGGPFAQSGATAIGGKIPVNPSGGLISRGHPIGASGLAQIHELSLQLRGELESAR